MTVYVVIYISLRLQCSVYMIVCMWSTLFNVNFDCYLIVIFDDF